MKENKKSSLAFGFVIILIAVVLTTAIATVFEIQKPEASTLTASATVASSAETRHETTKKSVSSKITTGKSFSAAPRKNKKTTAKKEKTTTKAQPTTKRKKGFGFVYKEYNPKGDKAGISSDKKHPTTESHGKAGKSGETSTTVRSSEKDYSTTKKYTTTTKKKRYDPYHAASYRDPEDFYDDHYDDFFDYYDAEDYYYDHCDD